jgi:iron complex transport system substrate-binding protein
MNSYSLSKILDHFNFSETLQSTLLQKYSEVNLATEEELFSFIRKIGDEGNKEKEGEELIFDLEERINIVKHKLKFIDESQKPSVLFLSDVIPPVFETNPYLTHLIETSGAKMYDVEATEDELFNPDVILVVSEQMERLFGGLANLLMSEEWKNANAVKDNRIFLIDGGTNNLQEFNINLASDVEILAEILYPQYLTFGGKGESWLKFEI